MSVSFVVILVGVILIILSAFPGVSIPSKERPWSLWNLGWGAGADGPALAGWSGDVSNAALLATANRLIGANGTPVTFTSVVLGAHDPVTGTPAQTIASETASAVLDKARDYGAEAAQQGDIAVERKRLWVAGPALTRMPLTGDKATFGGAVWSVVSCDRVNPDGTTYLYDIVVQR